MGLRGTVAETGSTDQHTRDGMLEVRQMVESLKYGRVLSGEQVTYVSRNPATAKQEDTKALAEVHGSALESANRAVQHMLDIRLNLMRLVHLNNNYDIEGVQSRNRLRYQQDEDENEGVKNANLLKRKFGILEKVSGSIAVMRELLRQWSDPLFSNSNQQIPIQSRLNGLLIEIEDHIQKLELEQMPHAREVSGFCDRNEELKEALWLALGVISSFSQMQYECDSLARIRQTQELESALRRTQQIAEN